MGSSDTIYIKLALSLSNRLIPTKPLWLMWNLLFPSWTIGLTKRFFRLSHTSGVPVFSVALRPGGIVSQRKGKRWSCRITVILPASPVYMYMCSPDRFLQSSRRHGTASLFPWTADDWMSWKKQAGRLDHKAVHTTHRSVIFSLPSGIMFFFLKQWEIRFRKKACGETKIKGESESRRDRQTERERERKKERERGGGEGGREESRKRQIVTDKS